MITFIFISIAAICLLLDYKAIQKSNFNKLYLKIGAIIFIVIANLLPFLSVLIVAISNSQNQAVMSLASWSLTIYTIITLARISFYIGFIPFRNPRLGKGIGAIFCILTIVILLNSLINTRTNLNIKNVTIHNSNIPQNFDGFRILLFSDLHIGSMINADKETNRVVEAINSQNVDMVIFAGDLIHINHHELSEQVMANLSKIKAPYSVYAALGNHDTGVYNKDTLTLPKSENIAHLNTKISQMGWKLLRDSTIYVSKGEDSIAVTGIDFTDKLLEYKHSFDTPNNFSPTEIFASIPASLFNIAISHLPQLWHPISEGGYADLTLSGHIHAMQIAFECCGRRFSPAMLMYKEWSGLYSNAGGSLYITDGIGSVGFYLRIGAKPELTVIELKR